ncbi:MAG TPA: AAA family ATPase [Solirubrobacteraceae bacterium]|nr:AAA family ATPase [Solirubrobacteraceae bacterium]
MAVLLDRDAELRELGRRLAEARASGRVIVVEGPAGIGKSTLLAAASRMATTDSATVLHARCSPLERYAAWGMARQLFQPLRGRPGWDELTIGAAGLAERALAPEAGEPAHAGDAMHAAARGLVWLASNLAERGPAVLLIDDVHWADTPSLRWLGILARSIGELRLAVLCAVRSGEPAVDPELLGELLASTTEPPMRVRPLGQVATETLVRRRLPNASGGFAHACHAVTGGNPFLLGALLTQHVADAITPNDETAARLGAFGSEQVARVLERQLARLPTGADALARAIAVLGPGAAMRHAAGLAGLEPDRAARAADALRTAGLLEDGRELTLVHPLISATLYASLPPGERALRHAAAAAVFAAERADAERVGLHLLHTEPARDATTVATLRDAARSALSRGAPQSAASYLRRALAEPAPDPAVDADVRLELGLALAAYMQPEAYDLLDQAVAVAATPAQRATIALRGARALGLAGHFETAVGLCRHGLRDAAGIPPALRARLDAELIANLSLQAPTVPEARDRLRRIAASPPPVDLWRILAAWEAACDGRPVEEARTLLASGLDALAEETDSVLGTYAKMIMIANGDLDAAREHCTALIEIARPRGWLIALAHGCFIRATALVLAGEILDAEADARLSFDIKLSLSPPAALLWSLSPLVDALVEADDLSGADEALTAAGQQGAPPAGALAGHVLLQSRARLRLAQHRAEDALADALAAGTSARERGLQHPVYASWRVEAAEALLVQGQAVRARELAREHFELSERLGTPAARGAALRVLAPTSGEPIPLLEQAVELLADSPAQLEHTRALVDLGAALRRANRRADAREPLRRALEHADRNGMLRLARRAREELRAAGVRPRRSALSGPDALTAAEHRVAELAANGHGNRAIAERLYVTQRTVETHLTHAFQKLGISSRAELAAALDGHAAAVEPALVV